MSNSLVGWRWAVRAAVVLLAAWAGGCESSHSGKHAHGAAVAPSTQVAATNAPVAKSGKDSKKAWHYLDGEVAEGFVKIFPVPPKMVSGPEEDFETRLVWAVEDVATPEMRRSAQHQADVVWDFADAMGPNFTKEKCAAIDALMEKATADVNRVKKELKATYLRNRPAPRDGTDDEPDDGNAYPSGHSTRAAFRAKMLGAIAPERETELLKDATLMAFDRMIAGQHFPTDIAAGFVLGQALGTRMINEAAADPSSPIGVDLAAAREEWKRVGR